MYYKIENKECEVYKKLHSLRSKEIKIGEENLKQVEEKIGLDFNEYLGNSGQQNFWRTTHFEGFKFIDTSKVDLKLWKEHNEHKGFYVPNRKTKLGREISDFLMNGLKSSNYNKVFDILNLKHSNRFCFPFVEIVANNVIVIYLRDEEPKDENVIEITKKEFESLLVA